MNKPFKFLPLTFLVIVLACNNNNPNQAVDTVHSQSSVDSMPLVTPRTTDSAAIIHTPHTGDNNVIMPDSAIK